MKLKRKRLIIALSIGAVIAIGVVLLWPEHTVKPTQNSAAYNDNNQKAAPQQAAAAPSFNKAQYSLTDSKSLWVIVNKTRPLPPGYAPANLVVPAVTLRTSASSEEMHVQQVTATAMQEMFAAANTAGYHLLLASGYRSEAFQKSLHASYVAQKGAAAADTDSARAGYSEHQTGLAFDVGRTDHKCEVDPCFANTPEAKWLADNAYKYGFVVRYQPDKQAVTGYIYEPWHLRYVGKDLAKAVYDTGANATLEEFFGLPAAPDYL